MRRAVTIILLVATALAACSGSEASPASSSAAPSTSRGPTTTAPEDAVLTESLVCDPLDERACLLPWPNDAFTVPAPTATGRRLAVHPDATPLNADGTPIDVTDQNRADGFSPGSAVLALVPGIDLDTTGIAPSTNIAASLVEDSPVVLLDTVTGDRIPYWGELDAKGAAGDQLLMIHPAVSLPEGHRISVAMRHLVDTDGQEIAPTEAFLAAMDGTPEPLERARYFRELLAELEQAGVTKDGLFLAWDFTVASAESLSGRVLHARELAYASIGDGAPAFTVTGSTDNGGVRVLDGTYEVPNFLTGDGAPGSTYALGDDGLPVQSAEQPVYTAPFHCTLPLSATDGRPTIVYGHGLLGDRFESDGLAFAAQTGVAGVCATDQIGMTADDVANLAGILSDLSRFPEQADRMQQGLLNQQFLARLLNSEDGFVTDPAFRSADGQPLVTKRNTVFVGNSQGGILGGAASAISSEWQRVVLGVPGINYSLLLDRSTDWVEFEPILTAAYPDRVDQMIALQLIQMLWDRGENNGYAQHLTSDPYPGIDPKQVLLVEAFGDHQVANASTEILARTIGAAVHRPSLGPNRSSDRDPQWSIPELDPADPGNAVLVVWDFGTPAPPPVNEPPTEPDFGEDPHGAGSREPLVLQQALTWLAGGGFVDVCNGGPCTSTVLTG